jgi:hypothetical protein
MFNFSQAKINLLSDTSRKFYSKKKRDKNDQSYNFNIDSKNSPQNCN